MLNLNSKYTDLNQKSDSKKLTRIFFWGQVRSLYFFGTSILLALNVPRGVKEMSTINVLCGGYKL
jgi:hypothetical protein